MPLRLLVRVSCLLAGIAAARPAVGWPAGCGCWRRLLLRQRVHRKASLMQPLPRLRAIQHPPTCWRRGGRSVGRRSPNTDRHIWAFTHQDSAGHECKSQLPCSPQVHDVQAPLVPVAQRGAQLLRALTHAAGHRQVGAAPRQVGRVAAGGGWMSRSEGSNRGRQLSRSGNWLSGGGGGRSKCSTSSNLTCRPPAPPAPGWLSAPLWGRP